MAALARAQVTAAHERLGLTTEEFAAVLKPLLGWGPSPGGVPSDNVSRNKSWRHGYEEGKRAAFAEVISMLVTEHPFRVVVTGSSWEDAEQRLEAALRDLGDDEIPYLEGSRSEPCDLQQRCWA